MASITIRNLDDEVKTRLRVRAAGNGRSMEEEARLILGDAVDGEPETRDLASIGPTNGVDLELPPRGASGTTVIRLSRDDDARTAWN